MDSNNKSMIDVIEDIKKLSLSKKMVSFDGTVDYIKADTTEELNEKIAQWYERERAYRADLCS